MAFISANIFCVSSRCTLSDWSSSRRSSSTELVTLGLLGLRWETDVMLSYADRPAKDADVAADATEEGALTWQQLQLYIEKDSAWLHPSSE